MRSIEKTRRGGARRVTEMHSERLECAEATPRHPVDQAQPRALVTEALRRSHKRTGMVDAMHDALKGRARR